MKNKKAIFEATGKSLFANLGIVSDDPPPPTPAFPEPVIETEKPEIESPSVGEFERSYDPSNERTNDRTVERFNPPKHRRTKRYSFEFYDDQLIALKKLRFEAEMRGENIPMSEMVREAIDEYLKHK